MVPKATGRINNILCNITSICGCVWCVNFCVPKSRKLSCKHNTFTTLLMLFAWLARKVFFVMSEVVGVNKLYTKNEYAGWSIWFIILASKHQWNSWRKRIKASWISEIGFYRKQKRCFKLFPVNCNSLKRVFTGSPGNAHPNYKSLCYTHDTCFETIVFLDHTYYPRELN